MAILTTGAPTSKTPGKIGDHLVDSTTGKVYECISVNTYGGHDAVTFKRKKTEYVWKCIGDGADYGRNTGSGLPTGSAPYQQLVTDDNGNAKWEDRLAYDDSRVVVDAGRDAQYVKVSDEVPSWASIDSPIKYWKRDIGTTNPEDYIDLGNGSFLIFDTAAFITTDNLEVSGFETSIVFPEKGVYFCFFSESLFNVSGVASADSDTPEITWDGDIGVIKKLDEKFLPEPLILYVHESESERGV